MAEEGAEEPAAALPMEAREGGGGTGGGAAADMAGGGRDGAANADALSDGAETAAAEDAAEGGSAALVGADEIGESAAPPKTELRAGLSGDDAAPAANAASASPAIGMVRL